MCPVLMPIHASGCSVTERKAGTGRCGGGRYSVKAHEGMINGIDGCGGLNIGYGAPEIATCGRDGCVRVWDMRLRCGPATMPWVSMAVWKQKRCHS